MVPAKCLDDKCSFKAREHSLGPHSRPARNIQSIQPVGPRRRSIVAQVLPVEASKQAHLLAPDG